VRRSTRPVSWAAIMTLRTNGERGDQCNFITELEFPDRYFNFMSMRTMSPR
jgi:hypothetical protein